MVNEVLNVSKYGLHDGHKGIKNVEKQEGIENGWKMRTFQGEVGGSSPLAAPLSSVLKKIVMRGRSLQSPIKSLANAVEKKTQLDVHQKERL